MSTKFKVMADAYKTLGLYKRIDAYKAGACEGWEKIAEERDFPDIRNALKYSEVPPIRESGE